MLTFMLPFLSVFLLFALTTTAQPYIATDRIFLACGSPTTTTTSDPRWESDENSKFVLSNIATTSFPSPPFQPDSSVSGTLPYSFARISNTSSFTYTIPVSEGPKFLRLYFYPATYSNFKPEQSFFSVSSNGFSLLTNFSAFLTASYLAKTRSNAEINGLQVPNFVKEFIIYVTDAQILNVTFTPEPSSYAFINGIEIVSMPEDLYFNSKKPKPVGITTAPDINNELALENLYRLNMGGGYIEGTQDTGMYRSWDRDDSHIYGAAYGLAPVYDELKPIIYTSETPNYTAPELVYRTQRSMGKLSDHYNLTWRLPVDSGFFYNLRLHFCNIIPEYNKSSQVIFKIFINNQTADDEIDLFSLTRGSGYPVFKDYIVFVNDPDGNRGKQDLWVAMHPNPMSELYDDAYLNGLEVFKLSMVGSLASPNPNVSPTTEYTTTEKRNKKAQNHVSTVVKGSVGYVDPEYYRSQQLTEKSDVYSFGVVLLEVLCARPVMNIGLPKEQVSLAEWGKSCYANESLEEIIDPRVKGAIAPECLRQFGDVAVRCLQEQGSDRPAMDEVVWGLEFALELQEAVEKKLGEALPENQELPFVMQGETTDDDVFTGSSAIRYGTSSISSSSDVGFKSEKFSQKF